MVRRMLRLVIDDEAKTQLRQAHNHIKQNSPQAAEKAKKEITASFHAVLQDIELHTPDKYKTDNDGSYRAYELFHYRIAYHVSETQITIVRIRHTKMNPLYY